MKIKTNITDEREVDITLPMFKKEQRVFEGQSHNYFAVLPDGTVIDIFDSGDLLLIKHWTADRLANDIINRLKWEDITEGEFLSAHKSALESLSLEPQLCETDKEIEAEFASKNHNPDDLKDVF